MHETGTCRVIDPWGGSYFLERLTADLRHRALAHIEEVEALGGMAKAIENGLPKLRIEEAAARTQARIDSGEKALIGVNTYRPSTETTLEILKVDNTEVRTRQTAKLNRLRRERDAERCQAALDRLSAAARTGEGNLLAAAVDAARTRATVGEMSLALERVWGRHVAEVRVVSGVYAGASPPDEIEQVRLSLEAFREAEGRPPRILVAKIGQDGHDRGQKVIASAFGDLGFDVVAGPLFATPEEVADQAASADVHVVGVSSLTAGHLVLLPALRAALDRMGRNDIMVVAGGIIPDEDTNKLQEVGIEAIFTPGTPIPLAARAILDRLRERLGYSQKAAE
jgi:methylmalonyl-CoA mutase